MRKLLVILGLWLACGGATNAWASAKGSGLVQNVYAQANGIAVFDMDGTEHGSWPGCAITHRYAIDTNSNGGQAVYAAVLGAHLAGRKIYAEGEGVCSLWGDSETIRYVSVTPN